MGFNSNSSNFNAAGAAIHGATVRPRRGPSRRRRRGGTTPDVRGNGGGDRIGRHLVAGMGIMLRQQRHGGQGKAGNRQANRNETVHGTNPLFIADEGRCAVVDRGAQGAAGNIPRQPRNVTDRLPGKAGRTRTSAPCPAYRGAAPWNDIRPRSSRYRPRHDIRT